MGTSRGYGWNMMELELWGISSEATKLDSFLFKMFVFRGDKNWRVIRKWHH
jgi:hypothetical protein